MSRLNDDADDVILTRRKSVENYLRIIRQFALEYSLVGESRRDYSRPFLLIRVAHGDHKRLELLFHRYTEFMRFS